MSLYTRVVAPSLVYDSLPSPRVCVLLCFALLCVALLRCVRGVARPCTVLCYTH